MSIFEPEDTQPNYTGPLDNNNQVNPTGGEPNSEGDYSETIPVPTDNTIQVAANTNHLPDAKKKKKRRYLPIILGGILLVLLLGAVGGSIGYSQGVNIRIQQEEGNIAMAAATQYAMAEKDILDGNLETAQRRLEYVIQIDPSFPGAGDKLAQIMIELAIKNQPTEVPTPTLSPTPDMRGEEEMFAQIQQHIRASEWDAAIASIEALRQKNSEYRVVDVDGAYYIALRNRGIDKILRQGSLEPGIYDIRLSMLFGPIDKEAAGYYNAARLYLTGAAFWEVDWGKVLEYFSQMYLAMPGLRDSSGLTASERYRLASIGYGDQLAASEDWCGARDYYWNALQVGGGDNLSPTATRAAYECSPPTEIPSPTENIPKIKETQPVEEPAPTQEENQPTATEELQAPTDTPSPP
jgi:hypothetical protein